MHPPIKPKITKQEKYYILIKCLQLMFSAANNKIKRLFKKMNLWGVF